MLHLEMLLITIESGVQIMIKNKYTIIKAGDREYIINDCVMRRRVQ